MSNARLSIVVWNSMFKARLPRKASEYQWRSNWHPVGYCVGYIIVTILHTLRQKTSVVIGLCAVWVRDSLYNESHALLARFPLLPECFGFGMLSSLEELVRVWSRDCYRRFSQCCSRRCFLQRCSRRCFIYSIVPTLFLYSVVPTLFSIKRCTHVVSIQRGRDVVYYSVRRLELQSIYVLRTLTSDVIQWL